MLIKRTNLLMVIYLFFTIFFTKNIANANPYSPGSSKPDGFSQVLMFMGTGIVGFNDSEPFPGIKQCSGTLCESDFFMKKIMNFRDDQVKEMEDNAKNYFKNEFGIDVDQLVLENRITFSSYTSNPDGQYRLYFKSGDVVPDEGWILRDGGFQLLVKDPNGIELGGNHEGKTATVLNSLYFGIYNILATNRYGYPSNEIILYYRSSDLVVASPDNTMVTFNSQIFHKKWGEGKSYIIYEFELNEDGRVLTNGREVVTFGKYSDITEYPDFPTYDSSVEYY